LSVLTADRGNFLDTVGGNVVTVCSLYSSLISGADGGEDGVGSSNSGVLLGRVAALKGAVEAGDFKAIADEKNAFILFNSGAYSTNKAKKNAAIAGTNSIFSAIRSGDKAAVKAAYSDYVASNGIKEIAPVSSENGQGYSSDYDYRVKTPAG
jgi:hypothetical protein